MTSSSSPATPRFLGIEAGATRTVAILADAHDDVLARIDAGPANLRLLNDSELLKLLQQIAQSLPTPDGLAIGMAGARAEADRARIKSTAATVWAEVPCYPTNDLETALAAGVEKYGPAQMASVLILSGTGSCCYGRNRAGKTVRVGGWGHLIGDKGSGYEIGLRALKAVVYHYDRKGVWPEFGVRLLHALQLNEPNDLIGWAQAASKAGIAALAIEVFNAWHAGDRIPRDILDGACASLAADGVACAHQLAKASGQVSFVLAGSVLTKQPRFARKIAVELRKQWPRARVATLERESVWGAVRLARENWTRQGQPMAANAGTVPATAPRKSAIPEFSLAENARLSPTEQRNPRSSNLDRLSVKDAVRLMLGEDATIANAVLGEAARIETAVRWITSAFKHDGRLFYIGAGTSGRLGVLDASECPPTFRTDPELVQGIIAGGQGALWRSVEGAEDDPAAGARALEFRRVNKRDVVIGIAASGRTPFVWGALAEARRRGAKTILLAFNPHLKVPRSQRPGLMITPDLGPEILTGSTRLKAGTATKLILNIFTTLAMVGIGKVVSNLMVDLNPSNVKLRDRAVRIVRELKGVDYPTAAAALAAAGWVIKKACAQLDRR